MPNTSESKLIKNYCFLPLLMSFSIHIWLVFSQKNQHFTIQFSFFLQRPQDRFPPRVAPRPPLPRRPLPPPHPRDGASRLPRPLLRPPPPERRDETDGAKLPVHRDDELQVGFFERLSDNNFPLESLFFSKEYNFTQLFVLMMFLFFALRCYD